MWEFNNTESPENSTRSIKQELVALCDQYGEFDDYCAFFCEASSLFIESDGDVFQSSVHDAQRFSAELIKRSQYFEKT